MKIFNQINLNKIYSIVPNNIAKNKQLENPRVVKSPISLLLDYSKTFTKEDLKLVETFKDSFISSGERIEKIKQNCFSQFLNQSLKLTTEPPRDLINRIHNLSLKLYAINQINDKKTVTNPLNVYSDWFNCKFGIQNLSIVDKFYPHPNDLAQKICGKYSKEDLFSIKKIGNQFKNSSLNEILKNKFSILDKMNNLLKKQSSDFIGCFTENELQELNKLRIKYSAIDNIQSDKFVSTKALESILYNEHLNKISIGDYIKGKGLVIDKLMVGNKPVAIMFSTNNKNQELKMYDIEKITAAPPIFTKDKIINSDKEDLCKAEQSAFGYLNKLNNSTISKINFKVIDFNTHIKPKGFKFPISMNNTNEAYFISDFVNYSSNNYKNAGIIIGIKLLKLLKDKTMSSLFLNAHAFNNKQKSPYTLYRRIGFVPYSHSMEELEMLAKKNQGKIPVDEEIKMYLENISLISKHIDSLSQVYLKTIP